MALCKSTLCEPRPACIQRPVPLSRKMFSFRDLVFVLILAAVLVFCVLLFEFRTFAASIAILASALLSASGVVIALLITRPEIVAA
jgi:multidrug efflux pump subunit AcrB